MLLFSKPKRLRSVDQEQQQQTGYQDHLSDSGNLAQLVERLAVNQIVGSSILSIPV